MSVFLGVYLLLMYLPWWSIYLNLLPFFIGLFIFLLLCFESSLHNFYTCPLSGMWFSNIFSQSMTHLLYFQQCLLKQNSTYFFFSFMDHDFGVSAKVIKIFSYIFLSPYFKRLEINLNSMKVLYRLNKTHL